jgi:hypothetical protein
MNKEYVLCAAVRRRFRREVESPYHEGTNDILDIEIGYRHHDIYTRFPNELDLTPEAQGFYTSKGRFVGRVEAMKIAYEAGQVDKNTALITDDSLKELPILNVDNTSLSFHKGEYFMLFSEDLY